MLYIIPTPIGNREDITLRAMRLFKELNIFVCEDTRTLKKLLSMYEIDYSAKEFYSLTSFTNQGKMNHYLNLLSDNDVGLVSEAGTPGLSDPGKSLIQLCNKNKIEYTVLPGANALVPAVVASGFDTSNFVYLGFIPQKKGRQTMLKEIINPPLDSPLLRGAKKMPVFFYESVHRFEKLLKELRELGFEGKISVSREISKKFEQIVNGSLEEVLDLVKEKKLPVKGEFVVGLY
ncbi:MAG TPA: 16S rRNA (cytidine(1402)-2'-O)-methyltransferase [Candidatus Absconditabacterales bacterium]|nr:16S rRNA (cytidine(1402)-2'-O)-methyltransferase [Candidatus Absconditabacterales bacterium]